MRDPEGVFDMLHVVPIGWCEAKILGANGILMVLSLTDAFPKRALQLISALQCSAGGDNDGRR